MKGGRPKGSKDSQPRTRRKAEKPARTMFTLPDINGKEWLIDLVQSYGGPARVCADLRISRELLDKWARDDPPAPFTVLLALWWQGPAGFEQAFSECHMTHVHNYGMRRLAEERVLRLETALTNISQLLGPDHPALLDHQKLLAS